MPPLQELVNLLMVVLSAPGSARDEGWRMSPARDISRIFSGQPRITLACSDSTERHAASTAPSIQAGSSLAPAQPM